MKEIPKINEELKKKIEAKNKEMVELFNKAKEEVTKQKGILEEDHSIFMLGFVAGYNAKTEEINKL